MFNANVVYADLPPHMKGMLVKTFDGIEEFYTVVINSCLNNEQQIEAYRHEMKHVGERDFDILAGTADAIEMVRHCI